MLDENNLPHELLLTTRQKTKIRNAFNNNMSTDLKLSKAQINKIIQSGGFLIKLLGPLLKTEPPLIKNLNVISQKCFSSFRINGSNISSRCRCRNT